MTDIEQIKREVQNVFTEEHRYIVGMAVSYLHSRGYLGGVPEGYVLVPKEPTTEILKAMCDCGDDAPWIDLWKAAIAAAPKGETKCY